MNVRIAAEILSANQEKQYYRKFFGKSMSGEGKH
jgi:hypothetical protein